MPDRCLGSRPGLHLRRTTCAVDVSLTLPQGGAAAEGWLSRGRCRGAAVEGRPLRGVRVDVAILLAALVILFLIVDAVVLVFVLRRIRRRSGRG